MRIAVPLGMVLILLVLGELFLQIVMPLPFSDRLYWIGDGHVKARLEPNQPVVNTAGNTVHINRLGFRGAEWTWRPETGTLRLVVLGGSAAFCYQVSDDAHTWPAQLERMLAARLPGPVEVLNLGLPGYDTANSKVNYLFTGRALLPHVVLVYHTWNDLKFLIPIDEARGGEVPRDALSGRPSTGTNPSFLERVFRRLQIVRRADLVLTRMRAEARENRYTSLEKAGERAHKPLGPRAWRWFQKNFEDVVDFVQSDSALPVLVSQSTLVKKENLGDKALRQVIRNNYVGMTLPRLADTYVEATRVIETVAREKGALYIDGYSAVPPDLKHLHDHVHLLDPGAQRLAETIARGLLEDVRFMETARRVQGASPR
jgi:hypothetical protein